VLEHGRGTASGGRGGQRTRTRRAPAPTARQAGGGIAWLGYGGPAVQPGNELEEAFLFEPERAGLPAPGDDHAPAGEDQVDDPDTVPARCRSVVRAGPPGSPPPERDLAGDEDAEDLLVGEAACYICSEREGERWACRDLRWLELDLDSSMAAPRRLSRATTLCRDIPSS
jgi:hypothetical protein